MHTDFNIDAETGISYGVLDARAAPFLYDDITLYGENLSLKAEMHELKDKLAAAIHDVLQNIADKSEISKALKEGVLDGIVELIQDAGLLSSLYEAEEAEYEYVLKTKEGDVRFQLTWLGGAPLIFVLKSPWAAYCAPCSPCVPGAGDLDTAPAEGKRRVLAYSLPPDELEDWNGATPFLVSQIQKHTEGDSCSSSPT